MFWGEMFWNVGPGALAGCTDSMGDRGNMRPTFDLCGDVMACVCVLSCGFRMCVRVMVKEGLLVQVRLKHSRLGTAFDVPVILSEQKR